MYRHPLFRPVVAIASLSYLVAVVMSNIMFDLMGNSAIARAYYCGLHEAGLNNPLRLLPLASVIALTAITLFGEVRAATGTAFFLPELSIVSAMAAVQLPLFGKCLQLQFRGCADKDQLSGPWEVHRNLLMSHTCVMLILVGSVFARVALLLLRSQAANGSFSSSISEASSTSGTRKPRRLRHK